MRFLTNVFLFVVLWICAFLLVCYLRTFFYFPANPVMIVACFLIGIYLGCRGRRGVAIHREMGHPMAPVPVPVPVPTPEPEVALPDLGSPASLEPAAAPAAPPGPEPHGGAGSAGPKPTVESTDNMWLIPLIVILAVLAISLYSAHPAFIDSLFSAAPMTAPPKSNPGQAQPVDGASK